MMPLHLAQCMIEQEFWNAYGIAHGPLVDKGVEAIPIAIHIWDSAGNLNPWNILIKSLGRIWAIRWIQRIDSNDCLPFMQWSVFNCFRHSIYKHHHHISPYTHISLLDIDMHGFWLFLKDINIVFSSWWTFGFGSIDLPSLSPLPPPLSHPFLPHRYSLLTPFLTKCIKFVFGNNLTIFQFLLMIKI